jgi:hypothetical protein
MWTLLLACAAPELLLAPDPDRVDAPFGELGPYGAAWVRDRAQARVTDVVAFDVIYPAEADASPAVSGAPVIVFIHGGLVAPERYHWLAIHAASRGWVTVLPEADLHLAITGPANGDLALDRLLERSDRPGPLQGLAGDQALGMGHSLGGVLAAGQFARDPRLDALVLLASFPADSTPTEDAAGPVLALTGATDVFDDERLAVQLARFPGPTTSAWVDGMNHYAWTDDATPAELDGDGPQTRPVDATRADALRFLDAWLHVRVEGGDEALLSEPFANVVLQ